jgi:predicted transcriptional regulator
MKSPQEIIWRQFPVRLEEPMFEELDRIAKQTNINKTTISRIAIQQFMDRLDSSGISNALEKVCAV